VTGRAEGKLELKKAEVFLVSKRKKVRLSGATVFIHVKGFSLARVTHLDVEHDILDNIIPPKRGYFLTIRGIRDGIKIELEKPKEVEYKNKKLLVSSIMVLHPYLKKILKSTRTWVGGKFGGIYIGFRKEQINRLEAIAREKFAFIP
jgi:hypothetical protein